MDVNINAQMKVRCDMKVKAEANFGWDKDQGKWDRRQARWDKQEAKWAAREAKWRARRGTLSGTACPLGQEPRGVGADRQNDAVCPHACGQGGDCRSQPAAS